MSSFTFGIFTSQLEKTGKRLDRQDAKNAKKNLFGLFETKRKHIEFFATLAS